MSTLKILGVDDKPWISKDVNNIPDKCSIFIVSLPK
jgi:hypothetical protein